MPITVLKKGTVEPIDVSPSSKNIQQSKSKLNEINDHSAKVLSNSVADIEDTFKRGYIDAGQYHDILRERGHAVLDEMIKEKGYFGAVISKMLEGMQNGWDTVVEAAKQTKAAEGTPGAAGVLDRAKPAGLMVWGMAQSIIEAMSGAQKVTGQEAEQWALAMGASPGAARILNITADNVLGFVPVGQVSKTGVKVIQGVMKIGAKTEKVAGEARAAATVAEDAIRQGLAVEGVEAGAARGAEATTAARGAEAATAAKDTVRLYRGEMTPGTGVKLPDWVTQGLKDSGAMDAEGRWFTDRRDIAEWYKKNAGETGRITYVDVAPDVAEAAKVIKNPEALRFSADAEHEFFVARDVANQAKVLTPQQQFAEDFDKFRREMSRITEPQSHAETARLADKLNIGLDDLRNITPGQTLTAPEMYAYLKALEPMWTKGIELAKVAKFSGAESDLNAFASHMSDFFTVAPIFRGAEVQAGRAVEILKETPPMKRITDMLMGWDDKAMADGNILQAMRTMAEEVSAATPQQMAQLGVASRTMWTQFQEGMWPKLREHFYNLLLPFAIIPNTIGNAIGMANMVLEKTAGALFTADKGKGLVGQEGWFAVKGYTAAFGDGMKAFGNAFTQGGEEAARKGGTRLDFRPHDVGGTYGRAINIPTDITIGVDNAARIMLRRGSYNTSALREGVNKGMSDSQAVINTAEYRAKFGNESLSEFIERRVKFPTKDMVLEGDVASTHHTYQDHLGYLAQRFRDIAQFGPLSLYFPFMKSPINLAKYSWDRTPGLQFLSGQLYKDIAAGGAKADEAIGRITIANMQGMYIYQMAQEGFITGSGPVDPKLRAEWLTTHEPYSIKTPWGWAPYGNFEPVATVLNLVTDFAQIHNQLDDHSAGQTGLAIMFSIMHGMGDKTWWKTLTGITDLGTALRQGQDLGSKLLALGLSPLTTVASGGPLGAYIKRQVDPVMREPRTLLDMFTSKIPGYSQNVPALRDPYGDPIIPLQNIAGPWLGVALPFLKVKSVEPDWVKEEGDRLKVSVPPFPNVIGGTYRDDFNIRAPIPGESLGVWMDPKQKDQAQEFYRRSLRDPEIGLETVLKNSQEYVNAPPALQREMFMSAMASYRKLGINSEMVADVDLGKKFIDSQVNAKLPLLWATEQDKLKQQGEEAKNLFENATRDQRENLMRWGTAPGED